jgi:hypothetical protein
MDVYENYEKNGYDGKGVGFQIGAPVGLRGLDTFKFLSSTKDEATNKHPNDSIFNAKPGQFRCGAKVLNSITGLYEQCINLAHKQSDTVVRYCFFHRLKYTDSIIAYHVPASKEDIASGKLYPSKGDTYKELKAKRYTLNQALTLRLVDRFLFFCAAEDRCKYNVGHQEFLRALYIKINEADRLLDSMADDYVKPPSTIDTEYAYDPTNITNMSRLKIEEESSSDDDNNNNNNNNRKKKKKKKKKAVKRKDDKEEDDESWVVIKTSSPTIEQLIEGSKRSPMPPNNNNNNNTPIATKFTDPAVRKLLSSSWKYKNALSIIDTFNNEQFGKHLTNMVNDTHSLTFELVKRDMRLMTEKGVTMDEKTESIKNDLYQTMILGNEFNEMFPMILKYISSVSGISMDEIKGMDKIMSFSIDYGNMAATIGFASARKNITNPEDKLGIVCYALSEIFKEAPLSTLICEAKFLARHMPYCMDLAKRADIIAEARNSLAANIKSFQLGSELNMVTVLLSSNLAYTYNVITDTLGLRVDAARSILNLYIDLKLAMKMSGFSDDVMEFLMTDNDDGAAVMDLNSMSLGNSRIANLFDSMPRTEAHNKIKYTLNLMMIAHRFREHIRVKMNGKCGLSMYDTWNSNMGITKATVLYTVAYRNLLSALTSVDTASTAYKAMSDSHDYKYVNPDELSKIERNV